MQRGLRSSLLLPSVSQYTFEFFRFWFVKFVNYLKRILVFFLTNTGSSYVSFVNMKIDT